MTGLALDGKEKNLGQCISRKHSKPPIDGPEGASVIYVPELGYYYLFQSYGWLGDTYDIRVGRSKSVTGPYTDWEGRSLIEESMGIKLAGSYKFSAAAPNASDDNKEWSWAGFALLTTGKMHKCWDFENGKPTWAVTGLDAAGLAYWGKYMYS